MAEKIRGIPAKFLAWWGKFTTRQKVLMISVVAVVIIALVILAIVLMKPKMVTLIICDSTKQSSQVRDLLDGDGNINYDVSDDGLTIKVQKEDLANAELILGANDIPAKDYDLDKVFEGGFSTTEADKEKKYTAYLEEKISSTLASAEAVDSADVQLYLASDDGTVLASQEDTYAGVMLTLNDDLDEGVAEGFANYVATAVGNKDASAITIIDSNGNQLFSGSEVESSNGTAGANTQLEVRRKAESMVKKNVKDALLKSKVYDEVEVGLNLAMNFDNTNTTTHEYSIADGREEGYIDSESHYTKEATGGYAGTPGTDSNDDTTYVINDNGTTTENITEDDIDRALNEKVTITDAAQGSFDKENSSISVVATTYQIYNEDQLEADGTLDNQTFDEFKAQNSQSTKVDVDDDMITTVANATGIAQENISMVAYQVPYFIESEGSGLTVSKILEYVLAGLILLMLGFVIFMSLRPSEAVETEPELEVLPTLESAMDVLEEESKEDIQAGEKSEAKILIEKFVDENPEAVASLLRNWLNEDWE